MTFITLMATWFAIGFVFSLVKAADMPMPSLFEEDREAYFDYDDKPDGNDPDGL